MEKRLFKIPVTWEMYSVVVVEASSLDEAIEIFDETSDDMLLPEDRDYVDGSFQREDKEICELQNHD